MLRTTISFVLREFKTIARLGSMVRDMCPSFFRQRSDSLVYSIYFVYSTHECHWMYFLPHLNTHTNLAVCFWRVTSLSVRRMALLIQVLKMQRHRNNLREPYYRKTKGAVANGRCTTMTPLVFSLIYLGKYARIIITRNAVRTTTGEKCIRFYMENNFSVKGVVICRLVV